MKLKPRDVQTQVKHKILEKYLGAWGGIILNGLATRARKYDRQISAHFVYVDCFSYIGKYSGDVENIMIKDTTNCVFGSPFIGIRVLDHLRQKSLSHKNVNITTNVILIEKKPQHFNWLLENLKAEGLGDRICHSNDFKNLSANAITVINADATALGGELLNYTTGRDTFSFYLIDPYGAQGIPYPFVKAIIEKPKHDVMINFVYSDLQRKAGAAIAGEEVSEKQKKHVEHWTNAFGNQEWIAIKREIENQRESRDVLLTALGITQDEAIYDPLFKDMKEDAALTDKQLSDLTERRLVDLYQNTLQEMDSSVLVKSIKLQFPDKDRPMFYLFLTTHNESGALKLNEILCEAELWEYELRYIRRSIKKQMPPQGQMALFPPAIPDVPDLYNERPSVEDCANILVQYFSGQTIDIRQIYQGLADEEFFQKEIDKALTHLKKNNLANYSGKKTLRTKVVFL